MSTKLETLASELETLRSEILDLEQVETPTDEQLARMESIIPEWDTKKADHDRLAERAQKIEAVRSASLHEYNREATAPEVIINRANKDPFAEMDRVRAGLIDPKELRGRAMDVVEQSERMEDDAKQHVVRMLEGKREGARHSLSKKTADAVARHILETGSEDYHESFERYLEDPQGYSARAALSLTSANGGYLVPFTLDPTIILTNAGSANPFRQISNVKTTATNDWNGVTSAGVNAGWLAEGTEDSDHSPTFGNLKITPQKASAWLYGSYEVLEDSDFSVQLPDLLADAKDRLEEAAFATGTGSGQPKGVVPAATTVASAAVATYAVADVYNTQAALPARFRGPRSSLAWLANQAIINKTRQFDTAGGSSFWANLGMGQPEELLGAPIYESTTMVGTTSTGSKNLLLGDFSQYYIVDRIGMSVLYEPLVKGANQRPTGQAGWFAFWRVGADASTTNAFRVLTIA